MTETATEKPLTTPFEYDRQLVISVNVSNFDAAVEWYREALGFEITALEIRRPEDIESLGTRFDGDTYAIGDMVKLCTFYDPDGNAWMLAQTLDSRDDR